MSEAKETSTPQKGNPRKGVLHLVWRELVFPLLVLLAVLVLAVALVEGKPLDPFLYAVF